MRAGTAAGIVALGLALVVPAPAWTEEIVVFAAASLTDVLREVGSGYATISGDSVTFNFGGSNELARQIRAGAPADVFFSADLPQMESLEQAGLVRRTERLDVLSNVLAVIVPRDSKLTLRESRDLLGVRHLALASPEAVPVGVYAKRYFESIGLWDALAGKVVPTLDVRASLAAVEAEHADAGVVYRTDAAISKRVRIAFEVPREQGPPIVYALAPVATSKKRDAAAALVRHLVGPQAVAAYERFGFLVLVRR